MVCNNLHYYEDSNNRRLKYALGRKTNLSQVKAAKNSYYQLWLLFIVARKSNQKLKISVWVFLIIVKFWLPRLLLTVPIKCHCCWKYYYYARLYYYNICFEYPCNIIWKSECRAHYIMVFSLYLEVVLLALLNTTPFSCFRKEFVSVRGWEGIMRGWWWEGGSWPFYKLNST